MPKKTDWTLVNKRSANFVPRQSSIGHCVGSSPDGTNRPCAQFCIWMHWQLQRLAICWIRWQRCCLRS